MSEKRDIVGRVHFGGTTRVCSEATGFFPLGISHIYSSDEHGNPRVAVVRKIKEINGALYDHVLHPHSDADLAEYETRFLDRIALSRQPA